MKNIFTLYISWDPNPAMMPWNLPLLGRPILWYGFFFALGFFLAYRLFQRRLVGVLEPHSIPRQSVVRFCERVALYVTVGAIVGARLGDVLFYQGLLSYIADPLGMFRFWEGGLSSHGGALGVLVSLWLLRLRSRERFPMLSWVSMLDLLCFPALLAGGLIRIGNFFNQEIVGIETGAPWAVLFGHPSGGLSALPRHPVQLYEALFYFALFAILWLLLRKRAASMSRVGKLSGLVVITVFVFRFAVEFLKVKQSDLIAAQSSLNMGQWLSFPLLLLGLLLFFSDHDGLRARLIKRHQR